MQLSNARSMLPERYVAVLPTCRNCLWNRVAI
jgi:hypothetical protein